jgi:hypothetical protein
VKPSSPSQRSKASLLLAISTLLTLVACGGTWVDDPRSFKRIFDFDKPPDVTVIHSYYWKSPHWTTEYRYYIALAGSRKFADGLTDASLMTRAMPDQVKIDACGGEKPAWFLPKPLNSYDAWLPKTDARYRVFRDEEDGTLFVCDQRL